jgi:hypothetical protein
MEMEIRQEQVKRDEEGWQRCDRHCSRQICMRTCAGCMILPYLHASGYNLIEPPEYLAKAYEANGRFRVSSMR